MKRMQEEPPYFRANNIYLQSKVYILQIIKPPTNINGSCANEQQDLQLELGCEWELYTVRHSKLFTVQYSKEHSDDLSQHFV